MRRKTTRKEPTIALINIVFLMLIFFMVSGTLIKPLEKSLKLIETRDLEGREPSNALVLMQDGRLKFAGLTLESLENFAQNYVGEAIRIMPDKNSSAVRLIKISQILKQVGAKRIIIVTENRAK
jgi:biopolymer transport protein ExbD